MTTPVPVLSPVLSKTATKQPLVMVHRVNTEQAFDFNEGDLYRVIRAIHAARERE